MRLCTAPSEATKKIIQLILLEIWLKIQFLVQEKFLNKRIILNLLVINEDLYLLK